MKNKINRFSILIIGVLFASTTLLNSCGKKWKQTTNVDFQFHITQSGSTELLHFTSGSMTIREIDFSGDRKKGGGVNFSNSITSGSVLDFSNGTSSPSIHYDIPQGTYNKIDITIKAFDEDPLPSIVLNGYYVNEDSDTTAIIYEFHSGENFYVPGKTTSGSNQIVLVEDRPATCQVTFDPNYWFDTVTENLLDDAEVSNVSGIPTILINESHNAVIYNLISSRIAEATTAVFQ